MIEDSLVMAFNGPPANPVIEVNSFVGIIRVTRARQSEFLMAQAGNASS